MLLIKNVETGTPSITKINDININRKTVLNLKLDMSEKKQYLYLNSYTAIWRGQLGTGDYCMNRMI